MSVDNPQRIDTSKLDEIINSYDCKKSNLIAILQKVQEVYKYLPEDAMIYIGTKIEGLSPATVYGVATFMHSFHWSLKVNMKLKYAMVQPATLGALCLY